MSEALVEKDVWESWLLLPATKALRAIAAARREALMESWAQGEFADNPRLEVKALGEVQAYLLLTEMSYEEVIIKELTDEQDVVTAGTPGDNQGD